jgi:hypothetical protein
MKKQAILLIISLFICIGIISIADSSPKKRYDPGTKMCRDLTKFSSFWAGEGAKVFKDNCKVCHFSGNSEGAKFLFSESKSGRAWNRIFLKRYPQCAKNGQWASLTEDERLKMNDYLFRYADDTYDPNDADDCS